MSVAALGACITVGLVVLGPSLEKTAAQAATPPMLQYRSDTVSPAKPVLEKLVNHLAELPDEPATAPFRYVRVETWALNTAVSPDDAESTLVSQQSEAWRRLDGTGALRTTTGNSLQGPEFNKSSPNTGKVIFEQKLTTDKSDGIKPQRLPSPTSLRFDSTRTFAKSVDADVNDDIPNGALAAETVHKLFSQQPLSPQVRANVWQLLSTVPNVIAHGETSDRSGRHGIALTIDDAGTAHGLPMRYLLIINPFTGALLEYDSILITDPGNLNVKTPAVLNLTVFLATGYAASATAPPQP